MTELAHLQGVLRRFSADRNWEQFHSPKNLAMAIAAEAGELLAELQWLTDEEIDRGLGEELGARVGAELADIFIYLLRFADVTGIDLVGVTQAKIAINADRYPAALPRGNATKYTRLGDTHDPEAEE